MQFASRLGSDCAFFIKNRAVFATGKGNVFSDIKVDLGGYYLLIVKPPIHIASAEAFQMVSPKTPENSLKELISLPVIEWKNHIGNDFEVPVFAKYPGLKTIKDKLYSLGAVYASMSGSGSAIYGWFDKKIDFHKEFPGMICWMKQL
jgi:4-diphosphocytidyl-2-C-methyl-D-erythritol kinase